MHATELFLQTTNGSIGCGLFYAVPVGRCSLHLEHGSKTLGLLCHLTLNNELSRPLQKPVGAC